MATNESEHDGAPEQPRATPVPIAGKLEIQIAGIVIGVVEIPAEVEPEALPQALKFEFKLPED